MRTIWRVLHLWLENSWSRCLWALLKTLSNSFPTPQASPQGTSTWTLQVTLSTCYFFNQIISELFLWQDSVLVSEGKHSRKIFGF